VAAVPPLFLIGSFMSLIGVVFGSAVKHPHALVLGDYSVHTSAQALERVEAGIARIGEELRKQGRL